MQRGEDRLPVVDPQEACPVSPTRKLGQFRGVLGNGPAAPVGFRKHAVLELMPPDRFGSRDWGGQNVTWALEPGAPDRLVVTGRRLDADGEVRFDDGVVPPDRVALPDGDPGRVVDRFSVTRLRGPGCYAYSVGDDIIVFRAVQIGHWRTAGDVVHGRSSQELERAIVEPRGGEQNGGASPLAATCRAATPRERRTNGFSGTPWEFACRITDWRGTHPYNVQVLPNWCYTAGSQRHPGRFGIQACGAAPR